MPEIHNDLGYIARPWMLFARATWILAPAVALAWSAVGLGAGPERAVARPPFISKSAKMIAAAMPRAHLRHLPFDDVVATNACNAYINALDFDHCYFLAADIEEFQREADKLDDYVESGDTRFAFKVFERFKERVRDRTAYVETLLDRGYDLDNHETYQWRRKDAPWPVDAAEWNELWRKKILHECVAREVALKLLQEKKEERATPPATPARDDDDEETTVSADDKLSPHDFILKHHRQYLTVIEDSDAEWVMQKYLNAFTQVYDPHSEYMSPSNAEDFDISMKLSLMGIGALLSSDDGAARVERLIPGGPAQRDGRLKPGDKIIAVGQGDQPPVNILHWPLPKAVRIIRGEKNTKVVLVVIPAADASGATTRTIDLIRDEVKLEEQSARGDVREVVGENNSLWDLGVISLPEFYEDFKGQQAGRSDYASASRDLCRILAEMADGDTDGVLLDLRNNGGGSLAEAVKIVGQFMPSGPVVQVRQHEYLQILSDADTNIVYRGPLVVLVNRQSASASEIVAGALQDYERAVIVGDSKTHGKGTVQTLVNLSKSGDDLGSLKVTTALFYRISGGSTQLRGVNADIVVQTVMDSMEIGEEFIPHALPWSVIDCAEYRPMENLTAAILLLRSRSEARLEHDPQFQAHRRLIRRYAERIATNSVSLNLNDRLAMAREDRELEKLRRQEERGADRAGAKGDPVLNEALRILADLTAWWNAPAGRLATANSQTVARRDD